VTRPVLYFVLACSRHQSMDWCREHDVRPHRPGVSIDNREEPVALHVTDIQRLRGLQGSGPIEVVTTGNWYHLRASGELLEVAERIAQVANEDRS
jgi:hypothetical protein